jgi:hypothetical protein
MARRVREELAIKFRLGGEDLVVADFFVDGLNVLPVFEAAVGRRSRADKGVPRRKSGNEGKAAEHPAELRPVGFRLL